MFTKNCRICLSDQNDNVTQLFTAGENDVKIPSETGQMYLDCLRLELIDNQNYPKHICNYCKLQLSVFHNFMMMAKRSYDKFNETERVIKLEKLMSNVSELEEIDELFDLDGDAHKSVLNSSRNSEAEYLDSELDEDADFDVSGIGDAIFTCDLPADIQDDDIMDDCVVEYLDDDEVILTNVKNEIIEVKDDPENDLNSYNSDDHHDDDDNTDRILEPPSKSPIVPTFYQLDMLGRDIDDELVNRDYRKAGVRHCSKKVTDKDYECKQCNFLCSSSDQLREHYVVHPECRLDCEVCGKKFKTQIMYQSHMNVHNGLPAFKCEMCDKTFNFRSNYQSHMLLHTNERPYQCDICDKGFRSKWDLIIHTRVHNDIRKYECKICGKRFRVSSHLTSHQYTHAKEKLFECDVCHQRYNSPRTLKQHKNTVHSNNYRFYCSQCDKKFKRKHHVLSHLKTHYKGTAANTNGVELEYRDEL